MNFHSLSLTAVYAILLCISSPTCAGQYRIGSWFVEIDKDPITDKPNIMAFSDSRDLPGAWIRLDCRSGRAGIIISVPQFKFKAGERAAIVLRIDDAPPIKAEVGTAQDLGIVTAKLSRNTYIALSNAKKIAARVFRESGDSWIMTFPASKTYEALKPMLAACPTASAKEGGPSLYDPSKPIFDPVTTPVSNPPAPRAPAVGAEPIKPPEPAPVILAPTPK